MNKHLLAVAWLHVTVSAFVIICVSVIWIASAGLSSTFEGTFIPGLVAMFGKPLATLLLTLAAVELISAVALTRAGLWSRYPLRFISFLLLFAFPIGTSVAIYTFWAMRGLTNQPALSNR